MSLQIILRKQRLIPVCRFTKIKLFFDIHAIYPKVLKKCVILQFGFPIIKIIRL